MKYLMMLVITLGLVGCGSSSKGPDAVETWVEFNNSRIGTYSMNSMSLPSRSNTDKTRYLDPKDKTIAKQTEGGIRAKAEVLTDSFYCFPFIKTQGDTKIKYNVCHYIANADSFFLEQKLVSDTSIDEEIIEINSVNSRSEFVFYPQFVDEDRASPVVIRAMNLKYSEISNYKSEKSIAGAWTFKTYIFNNNKLISLKSTISVTCTAISCTGVDLTDLTDLTYQELTDEETKANTWSGSQGEKTAEVIMSPDQKELSIMICDFEKIKSITECSFIAGTRDEEEGEAKE